MNLPAPAHKIAARRVQAQTEQEAVFQEFGFVVMGLDHERPIGDLVGTMGHPLRVSGSSNRAEYRRQISFLEKLRNKPVESFDEGLNFFYRVEAMD